MLNIGFMALLAFLVVGVFLGWVDFTLLLTLLTLISGVIYCWDRFYKPLAPQTPGYKPPFYVDFARSFFVVILVVWLLRSFIAEPFRIPSESMLPTLRNGDFILVSKSSYGVRIPVLNWRLFGDGKPERGDVVVFHSVGSPSVPYIKRVIGLPGDQIDYVEKQLYINGKKINRTLVDRSQQDELDPQQLFYKVYQENLDGNQHLMQINRMDPKDSVNFRGQVPKGHYFVLGDNRDASNDSRYWGFVPDSHLMGKAFIIWMNLDCITLNGYCGRIGQWID